MHSLIKSLHELDYAVLYWINAKREGLGVSLCQFVSDTTSFMAYGLPILLILIGIAKRDKQYLLKSFAALLTVFIADYTALFLKTWVNRQRPYEVFDTIVRYSDGGNSSFPSGHTTQAMAAAMAVAILFPGWRTAVPLFVWVALVGFSRVYLGVHYPSDVAGAMLLSGIIALLVSKLSKRFLQSFFLFRFCRKSCGRKFH